MGKNGKYSSEEDGGGRSGEHAGAWSEERLDASGKESLRHASGDRSEWRTRAGLCLAVFLGVAFLYVTGIGCPIRFLTGIPCPGCGITRACQAAVQLDFAAAFFYHPLFWLLPPAFLYLALGRRPYFGSAKRERIFLGILIALAFAVYLFRLIFAQNEAFSVDIHQGFIVRLVSNLLSFLTK